MVLDGLPVTTRERTIADLFNEPGADLSIVAEALRDGERSGAAMDTDRLVALFNPHAKRLGYQSGADLYSHLRTLTRVDEERINDLFAHTNLSELVDSVAIERLRELVAQIADSNTAAFAPLLAGWSDIVKAAVPSAPLKVTIPKLPRVELPLNLFAQVKLPRLTGFHDLQASLPKVFMPRIELTTPLIVKPQIRAGTSPTRTEETTAVPDSDDTAGELPHDQA
jgi:hypothetical protein